MAAENVLIDTSVIIDFLRKKDKRKTLLWKIKTDNNCYLSVITLFELYAGATTDIKRSDVDKISAWIQLIDLDATIASRAATYYRELKTRNRNIEFRDLFIAATATQHDLQLATLNTKHFQRIKDLALFEYA